MLPGVLHKYHVVQFPQVDLHVYVDILLRQCALTNILFSFSQCILQNILYLYLDNVHILNIQAIFCESANIGIYPAFMTLHDACPFLQMASI